MAKKYKLNEQNAQLGLLDVQPTLENLPTPKMGSLDKAGVHSWTNFYAAFSESFVAHGLEALGIDRSSVVLDPFSGSGTTMVAALKRGVPAIGVDLDPFSCLLARAKVATKIDRKIVKKLLRPSRRTTILGSFSSEAGELFDSECLRYASSVFARIFRSTGFDSTKLMTRLLADRMGQYDSEAVAIAALCIGASRSANLVKGSNPTWYRKGAQGEKDNLEALFNATQEVSEAMTGDLDLLRNDIGKRSIQLVNQDVVNSSLKLAQRKVSHVVTSPPYLTRMDYVVKHLPNLLILSGGSNLSLDALRNRMIGTPKMVSKGTFDPRWGETCVDTLSSIQEHSSYASSTYYIWTYFQYFQSLYNALSNILATIAGGAKGLIVVQDSYYKDIHVPLSRILVEMLSGIGCDAEIVRKEIVRPKLQRLNPAHKSAKRTHKSSEDVVRFEK